MARAAGSLVLTMLACVALTAPARAAEAVTNGGFGNDEINKLNGGGGAGDRCDGGPSRDRATRSCEKSKRL